MPTTKLPDKDLIAKYLDGVTSKAEGMNPKMGACMKVAQPFNEELFAEGTTSKHHRSHRPRQTMRAAGPLN